MNLIIESRNNNRENICKEINDYFNKKFKDDPLNNPLNWKYNNVDIKNSENYFGPCLNCKNKNNFSEIFFQDGSRKRKDSYFCSFGCNYSFNVY